MGHDGHDHDEPHREAHVPGHAEVVETGSHALEPHAHPREHAHPHAVAPSERAVIPLTEGAGRGKLLHFDAFSGVAGDMTIAALVDLGVPREVVERAVSALPVTGYALRFGRVERSGIAATTFDVDVSSPQPTRTHADIDAMLVGSALPGPVVSLSRSIFRRLGEAEARVHGIDLAHVHFHEVGAVDAIVDVVGASAALVWLGAEVNVAPLPMGHGFVRARHGVLPLPAPATVSCLAGVPTYGVDLSAELVTPTGAAIVSSVASRFDRWPSMAPECVGWGAGTKELPDRPNLLRLVLGAPSGAKRSEEAELVVLEANIDDMTGELAAYAADALRRAGALDAWIVPVLMKKGRPGLVLTALARASEADAVGHAMLAETSSIGLRRHPVTRTERPRTFIEVETPYGRIPVKVSGGPFGPPQVKPEFDACVRASESANVPVRVVVAAALARASGGSGLSSEHDGSGAGETAKSR